VQSTFVGPSAFAPNQRPLGLAFDRSGNLFVSTGGSPGSILKFTPAGTQSTFGATLTSNPRGMAFDGAGNLFVAEVPGNTTGDILEFTPAGAMSVVDSGIGRLTGNGGAEFIAFPFGDTPTGSNVIANLGRVGSAVISLSFSQITAAGTTAVTSIPASSAGTLPSAYELAGAGLAYDITTTATYTSPIIIGFQLPSLSAATFAQLRILHNEGGILVDRTVLNPPPDTTTQTIYASVSSLSPFVIAKLNAPTDINQCKNGGWQTFSRSDGTPFKNQGDCVQFVNTGK
jgi:hypothetical protein